MSSDSDYDEIDYYSDEFEESIEFDDDNINEDDNWLDLDPDKINLIVQKTQEENKQILSPQNNENNYDENNNITNEYFTQRRNINLEPHSLQRKSRISNLVKYVKLEEEYIDNFELAPFPLLSSLQKNSARAIQNPNPLSFIENKIGTTHITYNQRGIQVPEDMAIFSKNFEAINLLHSAIGRTSPMTLTQDSRNHKNNSLLMAQPIFPIQKPIIDMAVVGDSTIIVVFQDSSTIGIYHADRASTRCLPIGSTVRGVCAPGRLPFAVLATAAGSVAVVHPRTGAVMFPDPAPTNTGTLGTTETGLGRQQRNPSVSWTASPHTGPINTITVAPPPDPPSRGTGATPPVPREAYTVDDNGTVGVWRLPVTATDHPRLHASFSLSLGNSVVHACACYAATDLSIVVAVQGYPPIIYTRRGPPHHQTTVGRNLRGGGWGPQTGVCSVAGSAWAGLIAGTMAGEVWWIDRRQRLIVGNRAVISVAWLDPGRKIAALDADGILHQCKLDTGSVISDRLTSKATSLCVLSKNLLCAGLDDSSLIIRSVV